MIGRLLLVLAILATDYQIVHATAQDSEIIIYRGKKEGLMSVPLQSLYEKAESLGINLPNFPAYFAEDSTIFQSTGNWRGYIATWLIENDSLFLIKVEDCRIQTKDYKKRKSADLGEIFKEFYQNNRVFAFWFTGDLRIARGELISYVHMGFMSTFEKEIIIDVDRGVVKESVEYSNKNKDAPRGFQTIMTTNLTVDVPKSLKHCYEPFSDTICLREENGELTIMGYVTHDIEHRFDRNAQRSFVERGIDSCMQAMSPRANLEVPHYEKQRYGYVGWIDGRAKDDSGFIRTLIMTNFYSRLYIQITLKKIDMEKFSKVCDAFSHSLVLTEFAH